MTHELRRLFSQQSGQDLIEYALIVALIALGVVLALERPWEGDSAQAPGFGLHFEDVTTQIGS